MRGMSARKNVTFEIDVPDDVGEIETDHAKFKQILYNLMSNAVKFSRSGGRRHRARARARTAPDHHRR